METAIVETAAGALADAYRNLVDNQGVTGSEADALLAALSILNRLNSAHD
ncbi:MAG: hypothetical protein IKZ87_01295 [Actinomycetaceae bacterium]|nr:hypothetical protein [Actinomycetaceae bacterium]